MMFICCWNNRKLRNNCLRLRWDSFVVLFPFFGFSFSAIPFESLGKCVLIVDTRHTSHTRHARSLAAFIFVLFFLFWILCKHFYVKFSLTHDVIISLCSKSHKQYTKRTWNKLWLLRPISNEDESETMKIAWDSTQVEAIELTFFFSLLLSKMQEPNTKRI